MAGEPSSLQQKELGGFPIAPQTPFGKYMLCFGSNTISVLKHRFKTEDTYRVRKSAHVRICSSCDSERPAAY